MEAYPLQWPLGYKRTDRFNRKNSKFICTADKAQNFLRLEVGRLAGRGEMSKLIVSTNIPVRKDGGLYTDYMNKKMEDPGVAIYFKYKKKDISMCCDQYLSVWENVYALAKGIEALRSLDRWGVSDFLDRAFTGFTALPEGIVLPVKKEWWEVLDLTELATEEAIKRSYRELVKLYHPDLPTGNQQKFNEIQEAYEQAMKK